MGVADEYDAFLATKQAVYCILYDFDPNARYQGKDDRGKAIKNAIINLVNVGRNGTQTPYTAGITINKVGELKTDGDYFSQEYSTTCGANVESYTVTSVAGLPNGTIITDLNNNQKSTFAGNENLKIRIPKSSMTADVNIIFNIQAKAKTYPVFYGKTRVAGTQDYAVTYDPYGDVTGRATLAFKTNNSKIVINKTDADTNKPIPNTTFQLRKSDGTVIANATTNSQGIAEFTGLYQSNYILQEISSNEKYILDTKEQNISLGYNETKTLNITNKHKLGNLKITKVDKDNNNIAIGGVVFDLYSKEENKIIGTYTTDVNGEILVKNLKIGDYSWIERTTNKWYNLAGTRDVKVEWNTTNNQKIENELKKGQIRIIKIDKDNNEVRLSGIKFNVLDENNKVLETVITDSNGEALTSRYPIRDYTKLKIQECQTLWNYELNDEIKTVELKEEQISNITFENELKKGQIRVIKVDKDNNEVRLPGVEFKIYDENNNLVDTITTNEQGEAVSKELRIDKKYIVKESKTLSNYVLTEEIQTVTLTENQITDISFENELKKGQIRVIKVDKDDNEVLLSGVEFKIYDEDNNLVDTITTNQQGEAVSKELRIDKKYIVKESKTLSNYVLSEETQTVTLTENQITDIIFENEKIKGYIQITKTSAEDNEYSELKKGSPLADVTFEIYDLEDNLVDTITTDETGIAISKELVKNKYKIKEISSANYYLLNENIYNAEIIKHQEIVNVDITNDNVEIDVEITKTGFIETQCNDTIYYDFENIKNNSNVPLDNFTWSDTLPTDAVRLEKIYSGTWNEDLKYSVWYKTNKSEEYILFAEDLSTNTNNELDFTTLQLAEDEYVTDFEFRFGTVKIGYQEVETPVVYCKIVDDLENGYTFTNNTKVSGTYLEKYVEDDDNWTTVIYKKEFELTKILPRTGF